MRIIRVLGSIALWIGAALGVMAGGVWIAGQFGWLQPLIVISGSMEPEISTGDLLFATATPADELEVGDVVSLRSAMTGKLVTHRITEITPIDGADATTAGTFSIEMQGDANDQPDLETYTVSGDVWTPALQVPGGGDVVSKLMEPAVAVPILIALFALFGLSLLDEEDAAAERRDVPAGTGPDPDRADVSNELGDVSPGSRDVGHRDRRDGLTVAGTAMTPVDPLAELDEALAALGVDVDAYLPDDGVAVDHDERELVLSG